MSDIKKFESGEAWVEIDLDLCTAAGECVDICPADVYEIVGDKVSAERIGDCVECGACQDVCPTGALLKHWAW